MYFPTDTIVEMAFANDIDETLYGQSGYTDITQFVQSINGTLRGRQYEQGRTEAGTLSVTLDNGDQRFTMGTATSPYFPNVKPGRRFRIRGRNMVHPNVARTGSRDLSTNGLLPPPAGVTHAVVPIVPGTLTQLPQEAWTMADQENDLGYHFTATSSTLADGDNVLAQWYVPMEYGVRIVHSAYLWKVSGPSAGTVSSLAMQLRYFDAQGEEIGTKDPVTLAITPTIRPTSEPLSFPGPTSATPLRTSVGHAPLPTAKYVLATAIFRSAGTPAAGTYTFGIGAVSSDLPANLAPDISGWHDGAQWIIDGIGTWSRITSSNPAINYMRATWDVDDVGAHITIPRLVPGDTYLVSLEAQVLTGPGVKVSTDDGETGTQIASGSTWATYNYSFTASKSEQPLQFLLNSTPGAGAVFDVRRLNVQRDAGQGYSLAPSSATDGTILAWQRPYDLFEGWSEDFPLSMDNKNSVTITVVDRLKKLGSIILQSPYSEVVKSLRPHLWLPLDDDTSTNAGLFRNEGTWGEGELAYIPIQSGKYGPGTGTYNSVGEASMIGDLALVLNPVTDSGYYFPVPYTEIAKSPIAVIQPVPSTQPPPPTTTKRRYVYTSTFYATWSRSYEGSGATRWNDPPTLYHGYYDSSNGNQKSLIGFNYKAIQTALKGATVLSAKITLKGEHAGLNTGIAHLKLGLHNYASKPSTFGSPDHSRWDVNLGETEQETFSMGASAGTWFKNGTVKGITIGPAGSTSSSNYGFLRGATQSGKPYLTIQYEIWK